MPLLRLAVGSAAAVDEAGDVALAACINDEARRQLHHVEMWLPCLLGSLHALLAHSISDHLPCGHTSLSTLASKCSMCVHACQPQCQLRYFTLMSCSNFLWFLQVCHSEYLPIQINKHGWLLQ